MKIETEVILGVGAAARLLSVSRLTIHNYLRAGYFSGAFQLPTGVWRIPLTDIGALHYYERLLATNPEVEDKAQLVRLVERLRGELATMHSLDEATQQFVSSTDSSLLGRFI